MITYQLHNQDWNLHLTICTPQSTSGVRWGYCLMWQLSLDQKGNQTGPVTQWWHCYIWEHILNSLQSSVHMSQEISNLDKVFAEISTIMKYGRRKNINYMWSGFLIAVLTKTQIFWDMMPSWLVYSWTFQRSSPPNLQGVKNSCTLLRLWRWGHKTRFGSLITTNQLIRCNISEAQTFKHK